MKKTGFLFSIFLFFSLSLVSSCVKNEDVLYTDTVVEMDAATWNANSVGVTYPVLTRRPAAGRASTATLDPVLSRTSGTIQLRVNLVGAHRSTDTEVTYEVVTSSTTAVAGTHYAALPGKLVIPSNSSFGVIDISILNPGPSATPVDLVIKLTSGTNAKLNTNYTTVGLRISQT
jgi:hypothetical protein